MSQNVFPVKYGPDFDRALEMLVFKFFTRLEELILIPDFKQVIEESATESVMTISISTVRLHFFL